MLDPGFYGRDMHNDPTSAARRHHLRALAETGLDVAAVGAWVAAAELRPARRRVARGALVALLAAVAIPEFRAGRLVVDAAGTAVPDAGSGLPSVDAGIRLPADELSAADPAARRRVVLTGAAALTAAVAASAGVAVGGRRLERRWLARLHRNGHPHPHRALGLRMAGLYAVLVVPGRLQAARRGADAARRDAERAAGLPPA